MEPLSSRGKKNHRIISHEFREGEKLKFLRKPPIDVAEAAKVVIEGNCWGHQGDKVGHEGEHSTTEKKTEEEQKRTHLSSFIITMEVRKVCERV